MSNTAISADRPQTSTIIDAIYTIATTQSGVTMAGGKKRGMPTEQEVAGTWPFFIVLSPKLAGSVAKGQFVPGRIVRTSGMSQPVRDYLCYWVWQPLRDPTKTAAFTTPEEARDLIEQAFTLHYTLDGACRYTEILDCSFIPEMQFTSPAHNYPYPTVKMVLRVTERLFVAYN